MRVRQYLVAATIAVLVAGCADPETSLTAPETSAASLQSEQGALKDEYVVLLKPGSGDTRGLARQLGTDRGGVLLGTFEEGLAGFGVRIPAAAVEGIRRNPNVLLVSPNYAYSASHHATTQTGATWGLDRIDQRNRPTNGLFSYDGTGAGVRAYIVDSGIRSTHLEFGGRVLSGYSVITDGYGTGDPLGHGTHVAGIAGGTTWGVAKLVSLVPVRVLNSSNVASSVGIIDGLGWILANHVKPAVVNMSLGILGGPSTDAGMEYAVNQLINAGVQVVVSAGNFANLGMGASWDNACNYSPARVPNALTVASTTSTDTRAASSKSGPCVDLFAPGDNITSAGFANDTDPRQDSGTSMAAPHVTGAVALYLQKVPSAAPSAVRSAIISNATLNLVTSLKVIGTPNRLLYWGVVPHANYIENFQQTNVSGSPMLSWDQVVDAESYRVDLVVAWEEYDDYNGTSNLYDVSNETVGAVTVTSMHDVLRTYTNLDHCFVYQSINGSASYAYHYEVTPLYAGGFPGVTRRHAAYVAPGSC